MANKKKTVVKAVKEIKTVEPEVETEPIEVEEKQEFVYEASQKNFRN